MPRKNKYDHLYEEIKHEKIKLNKDETWNPVLKYSRNAPCPCGSGKKFKKCHKPLLPVKIDDKILKDSIAEAYSRRFKK